MCMRLVSVWEMKTDGANYRWLSLGLWYRNSRIDSMKLFFVEFSTILAGFYSRFYYLIVKSLLFESPDYSSYMVGFSEKILQNLSISQFVCLSSPLTLKEVQ